MKNFVKKFVKRTLFNSQRIIGGERQSVLLGEIRAEQVRTKSSIGCLADAEFSVFSQWGEDGIISWLVDQINPTSKTFVEFGVEDYRESNTRYMLMARSWSGLVIDGGAENVAAIKADAISYKHDLKSICSFITKDNIAGLLSNNGYAGHLSLLSVDIDGVDYWVLEQIDNSCDIIVVEYNDIFGSHPITVPYDAAFVRHDKHWSGIYWGASLGAFKYLLEKRDYIFVGTNSVGTNAFFVAKSHWPKINKRMKKVVTWPCKMRETRQSNGDLAYKTYDEMRDVVAALPVIDVISGKSFPFGSIFTKASK